jgi:hypothetical protein
MPDLIAYDITLNNHTGALPVQAVRAHALNGLFHAELGKRHSALVEALHHGAGPMPFSLTPLFNAEEATFTGFRVGVLTAAVGDAVAETWGGLAAKRAEVQLGSARLSVLGVEPEAPALTYEQLQATAPAAHGVRLRFETPVRFKSGVLPTPRAVWQAYALRWETFAPNLPMPPEFGRWAGYAVEATEVFLTTAYAPAENTVEWKGAMGEVEYQAKTNELPAARAPDYLKAWQALALLAEFCGTGEKATMGLGRTQRVKFFGRHRAAPERDNNAN